MTHDCEHQGHIWLDTNDRPYERLRRRSPADNAVTIAVHCAHCPATRDLLLYSQFSGARAPGQPIDTAIPPSFKAAMDRALAESTKDTK